MSTTRNVAVIVGSLRKESFNRKMAKAMIAMAPPTLKLEIVEIGQLPHYNQDFDAEPPQEVKDFKGRVQQADAVLFVTPEYNRSVPGVLKNAIDVASRPYGKSAWNGKPGAVFSLSPGPWARSAPITTFASRWCSSTFPPCRSPRPMSAAQPRCSATRGRSPTTQRGSS